MEEKGPHLCGRLPGDGQTSLPDEPIPLWHPDISVFLAPCSAMDSRSACTSARTSGEHRAGAVGESIVCIDADTSNNLLHVRAGWLYTAKPTYFDSRILCSLLLLRHERGSLRRSRTISARKTVCCLETGTARATRWRRSEERRVGKECRSGWWADAASSKRRGSA